LQFDRALWNIKFCFCICKTAVQENMPTTYSSHSIAHSDSLWGNSNLRLIQSITAVFCLKYGSALLGEKKF